MSSLDVIRGRTFERQDDPVLGPTYITEWSVLASSQDDALARLRAAQGIKRGVPYKDEQNAIPDPNITCQRLMVRSRSAAPVGGIGLYTVIGIFHYPRIRIDRPLWPGQPAKLWIESVFEARTVEVDRNGKPLINSAGDQFEGIQKFFVVKTLVAQWIVSARTWLDAYARLQSFEGKVNSEVFVGAPAGTLLCTPFRIEEVNLVGLPGWSGTFMVTARFMHRPRFRAADDRLYDGWTVVVENRGYHYLDRDGKRTHILLPDGRGNELPARAPQFLSSDGRSFGDTITVRAFELYDRADFNAIGIPMNRGIADGADGGAG